MGVGLLQPMSGYPAEPAGATYSVMSADTFGQSDYRECVGWQCCDLPLRQTLQRVAPENERAEIRAGRLTVSHHGSGE